MSAEPSIWKKEIKLRRSRPVAVEAVAASPEPRAEPLPPPVSLAPRAALEPRFRRIEALGELLDQYAHEFPDRAEERRRMLARLAQSAVDGVLPSEFDGVVHTLFYDLLRRQDEPPKSFWKREISLSRGSKQRATKLAAVAPAREPQPEQARPAAKTSFWKKERSLRPKQAKDDPPPAPPAEEKTSFWKKERSVRSRKPKDQGVAVEETAPSDDKKPFWKKELSLSRPKRERKPKEPKEPKPAKAPKPPKEKSGLKRELSLPRPRLPRPTLRRGNDTARIVGLRIGSSQLAAALVHNNGSAEVLKLARSPLERGIVAGGEVRDADALAGELKRFFSQHKLPRRGIRLGVATNRIGVRVLEVPLTEDPKQLENAIRFRAQEVLPIPIAEAVLDHVVIGAVEQDGVQQNSVLLVFAHRDLVDGYLDACKRAGLNLIGIDFDAFALLRALSSDEDQHGERRAAHIAVSIGHERTIFAVSDGKICDFARVLEWGGSSLDVALARALDLEIAEAAQIKQVLTLDGDDEVEGVPPLQLEAARAAVRQELQLLARELVSSLQFYQSRPGSLDIGDMLLTGGGAQLNGIDAELGRQLGVPVRLGDPLQRVKLGKDVPHPASQSLTIAVGLAIEERG